MYVCGGDDDHFIIVCRVCCSVCSILLFGILVCLTEKLNSVSDILELAVYTQCTPCVERPGLLLQLKCAFLCIHVYVWITVKK